MTRRIGPGERVRLKLRLSRKARRAIASALDRRKRLRAKLRIKATDAAGNSRTVRRTVALRR